MLVLPPQLSVWIEPDKNVQVSPGGFDEPVPPTGQIPLEIDPARPTTVTFTATLITTAPYTEQVNIEPITDSAGGILDAAQCERLEGQRCATPSPAVLPNSRRRPSPSNRRWR